MIKLDKCSDDVFISPIVITVKHDKSIKVALDYQLLNEAINKNKYQMQSIGNLMDAVTKYLSDSKQIPGEFFFLQNRPKVRLQPNTTPPYHSKTL